MADEARQGFEVEFYRLPGGVRPVEVFLDSLDIKMRAKALAGLDILADYGNTLRAPYTKPMGDGVFELRIAFGGDISRIFYFFFTGRKIVLTNGFIKKTQKTPTREIELAKKYKADYGRRVG
jgi:phage-related protein